MAANPTLAPIPDAFPSSGTGRARVGDGGLLRGRFQGMKDVALEAAMEKGDSWARKVAAGDSGVKLDDIPRLISVLDLKIVPRERTCITPAQLEHYKACEVIAAGALKQPQKLVEDWDE